jgi:hypothetical protein
VPEVVVDQPLPGVPVGRFGAAHAPKCPRVGDRISDALGHLHRMVRVLDDSFDEFAYGG